VKQRQVLVSGAIVVTAMAAFTSASHAEEATSGNATVSSAAEATSEPAFGQRGQWYLYAPTLLGYHRNDQGTTRFINNGLQFGGELGAFLRNHLSVGLRIDGSYGWQTQQVSSAGDSERFGYWSTGLRLVVGWQRPLSSWVSFWPKLSLGGSYGRSDQYVYDSESETSSKRPLRTYWIDASARLPLVLHVTRHLFVEIAYEIDVDVGRGDSVHSVQATSSQTGLGLGGWF
jgi:hypothetical protein